MARILVIDDEELVRFALRAMLENAGHDVEEAADGEEGLTQQKEAPFDIIIIDIFMPHKEGTKTIMELRRDYPELKLIAISGGGDTGNLAYLEMVKKLGADLALSKPLIEGVLLSAVDGLLS